MYILTCRARIHYKCDIISRVRSVRQHNLVTSIRLHWLITSWPVHLSAFVTNSVVIDFSFTVMMINSAVNKFWPNISGAIHPVYFYILYIVFFKKSNYSGLRGFWYRTNVHYINTTWLTFPSVRLTTRAVDSPVRTGLQHHGRLICLCRLWCNGRLYHPSLAGWSI